ncbi:hypothetical protein CERZMDRAFT_92830 [Cercospora zeae-maydis SCOH1-5]|uniref:Uncharacterized protein n=1 Tax=Cercospora zeae-maydis SCOH1-5 TaxID=717836 RepID=A0A6A6FTH1_9PEZI|nr:hypothetical protein CERZMDRAFT_92830 [Cercospora zeae-maydis SCOH1-5]
MEDTKEKAEKVKDGDQDPHAELHDINTGASLRLNGPGYSIDRVHVELDMNKTNEEVLAEFGKWWTAMTVLGALNSLHVAAPISSYRCHQRVTVSLGE